MPDNQMSLASLGLMLPQADPRGEDYRAQQRRMQEIALYNQLTGAGAPVPRPDPRGQDYRAVQRRQQEIETYNQIMADPRYNGR